MQKYIQRGYNDKVIELVKKTPFLAFDLDEDGKTVLGYIIEKNNLFLLKKMTQLPKVDLDILDGQFRCAASICLNMRNKEALKVIFFLL